MKSIICIIIIFLTISFTDTFSIDTGKEISDYVGGKVIDERNFPVPFVKVIINGKEAETDKSGNFKILDITYPYDVVIADKSSATAVVYKNLSINNPDLILFGNPNPQNSLSAVIKVKFPEVPTGSSAVIKFISTDVFYCGDAEISPGEKSKTLIVYWPASQKTINGNVILLQKNSTKYELYSDVPSSLYENPVPFNVTFSKKSSNDTKTSDLTVFLSIKDIKTKGYSISADFLAYYRNSQMMLTRQEGNTFNTKSIIPSTLPLSYRLKVSGFADYGDGSGFANSVYSKPGATVNLQTESPPELQTPSDKFLGASGNTQFNYSPGSGAGIFVIQFHSSNPEINFYVVTSERNTRLDYLSREEFRKAGSVEFKWSAKKYLTYFSVNEFVKPLEFRNDIGYKAVLYSTERTFMTGYY
ncbi:MAG: hypothetical protein ABI462_07980 [Ignavibacteria bacterium]